MPLSTGETVGGRGGRDALAVGALEQIARASARCRRAAPPSAPSSQPSRSYPARWITPAGVDHVVGRVQDAPVVQTVARPTASASWLFAAPATTRQRSSGIVSAESTPPVAHGEKTSHSASKHVVGGRRLGAQRLGDRASRGRRRDRRARGGRRHRAAARPGASPRRPPPARAPAGRRDRRCRRRGARSPGCRGTRRARSRRPSCPTLRTRPSDPARASVRSPITSRSASPVFMSAAVT